MKLVTMKYLLDKTYQKQYAIPAINVSNMETINALFEVAEKLKAPIILQVAPIQITEQKITYDYLVDIIKLTAMKYKGEYAIHLDHGTEMKDIEEATVTGFTSVMLDGSKLPYDENIAMLKKARIIAKNITLEGELGILNEEASKDITQLDTCYTNPDQALNFVKETKVDCLAVSIGNAHGVYKGKPKLNFDILSKISKKTKIPIVLHGASGLSVDDITKAIKFGVSKINFYTSVDFAFTRGIKRELNLNGNTYMMTYIETGRQEMMKEIEKCIKMCHADGMC